MVKPDQSDYYSKSAIKNSIPLIPLDDFPTQKPYVTSVLKTMAKELGTKIPAIFVCNGDYKEKNIGVAAVSSAGEYTRQPRIIIPAEYLNSKSKLKAFTAHAYSNYLFTTDPNFKNLEITFLKAKTGDINIFTDIHEGLGKPIDVENTLLKTKADLQRDPARTIGKLSLYTMEAAMLAGVGTVLTPIAVDLGLTLLDPSRESLAVTRRDFIKTGVAVGATSVAINTKINNNQKNELLGTIEDLSSNNPNKVINAKAPELYQFELRRAVSMQASGLPKESFIKLFEDSEISNQYKNAAKIVENLDKNPTIKQTTSYRG